MRQTLAVTGLREARDRVDDVGDRARRPEPALRSSATLRDLQESARRRFTVYRFRPASKEWVERKRAEGLSTRTMVASGRLRNALVNAVPPARRTVYNGQLTWGLPRGRSDVYYAQIQALRGRRAVVIDRLSRSSITDRLETFIAHGFITS